VHEIGVLEIGGTLEEGLQAFLGARNHGGIVTKEQTAEYGYQYNTGEVATATFFVVVHYDWLFKS
jgi:hypothetical protein